MFWSRQRSHFRWLAVVQVPDKTKVSRNRQRLLVGTYDSTAKIKARGERDAANTTKTEISPKTTKEQRKIVLPISPSSCTLPIHQSQKRTVELNWNFNPLLKWTWRDTFPPFSGPPYQIFTEANSLNSPEVLHILKGRTKSANTDDTKRQGLRIFGES